jgi:hypothetical protein
MHKHILDLIPFYVTGKISLHESNHVRLHLAECRVCHQAYMEWKAIAGIVYQNAEDWAQPLPAFKRPVTSQVVSRRQFPVSAALLTALLMIVLASTLLTQHALLLSPTATVKTNTPYDVVFPPPTATIVILPTVKGTVQHNLPLDRCAANSPSTRLVSIYVVPNQEAEIIAQLYPGEFLIVTETNGEGWFKVLGRDGLPIGWLWNRDAVISGTGCTDLPQLSSATPE